MHTDNSRSSSVADNAQDLRNGHGGRGGRGDGDAGGGEEEQHWICTLSTGTTIAPQFVCLTRNTADARVCCACGTARFSQQVYPQVNPFFVQWKREHAGDNVYVEPEPVDKVDEKEMAELEAFQELSRKCRQVEHAHHVHHRDLDNLRHEHELSWRWKKELTKIQDSE